MGSNKNKMALASGKPRGRTTSYAYFVQTYRAHIKRTNPEGSVVFTDFSRECAGRWKAMSENEKQPYLQYAEQDKHRYENEMRNYSPPEGDKKRRKSIKDPNAPKLPLSAYFFFSSEERPKLKTRNPHLQFGQIGKELGRMWRESPAGLKEKYQAMAEMDKARYDREKGAYGQKGY